MASSMLNSVNFTQEFLIAAEEQGKQNLTLNGVNRAVWEVAQFHQSWVGTRQG